MSSSVSLLASLALSLAACGGYSKETVSLYREHVGVRVPNQQRLVALATDEAVERLDFKPLAGKRVTVELNGVFPHSREDVLGYIQAQVEGKLARDGAIVVSGAALSIAPAPAAPAEGEAAPLAGGSIELAPDAEYRVVVGVAWAGVDTHDRKSIDLNLMLKQWGLGAGGVVLGGLLISAGGPDEETGESDSSLQTLGGIALLGGVGGAIAWRFFQKPVLHTYRLLGRVRLSAQVMPLVAGGRAFQVVGEGQTELVIDPTAEEGYLLQQ